MEGQSIRSINVTVAAKDNTWLRIRKKSINQGKVQLLLKATHGWRLADIPAWDSNCEGLICHQ